MYTQFPLTDTFLLNQITGKLHIIKTKYQSIVNNINYYIFELLFTQMFIFIFELNLYVSYPFHLKQTSSAT